MEFEKEMFQLVALTILPVLGASLYFIFFSKGDPLKIDAAPDVIDFNQKTQK